MNLPKVIYNSLRSWIQIWYIAFEINSVKLKAILTCPSEIDDQNNDEKYEQEDDVVVVASLCCSGHGLPRDACAGARGTGFCPTSPAGCQTVDARILEQSFATVGLWYRESF